MSCGGSWFPVSHRPRCINTFLISASSSIKEITFSDRLEIEMVKILSYHAQEKEEMALDAGLTILGHLGVKIPK